MVLICLTSGWGKGFLMPICFVSANIWRYTGGLLLCPILPVWSALLSEVFLPIPRRVSKCLNMNWKTVLPFLWNIGHCLRLSGWMRLIRRWKAIRFWMRFSLILKFRNWSMRLSAIILYPLNTGKTKRLLCRSVISGPCTMPLPSVAEWALRRSTGR